MTRSSRSSCASRSGSIYLAIGHYTLGYFEVRARKSATLALR